MNTAPLTMQLSEPTELLAYVPYRFGFVPAESLVVLAVVDAGGGRYTLGLAARLDLADLRDPGVMSAAAVGVGRQLDADPTHSVITVIYSEAPFGRTQDGRGVAGEVLRSWLDTCDYASADATFLVGSQNYTCMPCIARALEPGGARDVRRSCCPPQGRPVDDFRATAVAAHMVAAGEALARTRQDLACPRSADPDRAKAAAGAAAREHAAMLGRPGSAVGRWRERALDSWGRNLAAQSIERPRAEAANPAVLGRLGAALADAELRDAVVAWVLGGSRRRPGSASVLQAFDAVITGTLQPPPTDHLDSCERLLAEIVRHAPAGGASYPLAILAWLAWWRGEGARADVVLQQCLQENAACRLGQLLAEALDAGVRPGWARPHRYAAPEVG